MPTYLKYEYFFYFELRSDPKLGPDPILFQLSRIEEKKSGILIPVLYDTVSIKNYIKIKYKNITNNENICAYLN